MRSAPIDVMLDAIEWTEREGEAPAGDELYATHEGVFRLGDVSLRVYQLNNGQRVIDADDMEALFGFTAAHTEESTNG